MGWNVIRGDLKGGVDDRSAAQRQCRLTRGPPAIRGGLTGEGAIVAIRWRRRLPLWGSREVSMLAAAWRGLIQAGQ